MDSSRGPGIEYVRPKLPRLLAIALTAYTVVFVGAGLLGGSWIAFSVLVVLISVVVPLQSRWETVTLTPAALEFYASPSLRRSIPWAAVRAVTIEGAGPARSVVVVHEVPGGVDAVRLGIGRGFFFGRYSQDYARGRIERWWTERTTAAPGDPGDSVER